MENSEEYKEHADAVEKISGQLKEMLFATEHPLDYFNREHYADNFTDYCEKFHPVFQDLERSFDTAEDKEVFLSDIAETFAADMEQKLFAIPKKRNRERSLGDYNMSLVVFLFPAFLAQGQGMEGCSRFPQILADQWKKHFPSANLSPASFETINSGFKTSFCYITTAVCESLHKPDDCYELSLLRGYRDTYLVEQPGGQDLIREYYDVAPTIVKHINRRSDRADIYDQIWKQYLQPCIHLIEEGKDDICREVYQTMVYDLKESYFLS